SSWKFMRSRSKLPIALTRYPWWSDFPLVTVGHGVARLRSTHLRGQFQGISEKDWLILNRRIYQIKLMARVNYFDAQRNSPEPTLSMRRKSNNWDNGDDSVDRSLVKLDCKFVFCNPCLGCLVAPSVV